MRIREDQEVINKILVPFSSEASLVSLPLALFFPIFLLDKVFFFSYTFFLKN